MPHWDKASVYSTLHIIMLYIEILDLTFSDLFSHSSRVYINFTLAAEVWLLFSNTLLLVALFSGSPSFRAIIPCMTFDPTERKAEGELEPGRFCHMTMHHMPTANVYME